MYMMQSTDKNAATWGRCSPSPDAGPASSRSRTDSDASNLKCRGEGIGFECSDRTRVSTQDSFDEARRLIAHAKPNDLGGGPSNLRDRQIGILSHEGEAVVSSIVPDC